MGPSLLVAGAHASILHRSSHTSALGVMTTIAYVHCPAAPTAATETLQQCLSFPCGAGLGGGVWLNHLLVTLDALLGFQILIIGNVGGMMLFDQHRQLSPSWNPSNTKSPLLLIELANRFNAAEYIDPSVNRMFQGSQDHVVIRLEPYHRMSAKLHTAHGELQPLFQPPDKNLSSTAQLVELREHRLDGMRDRLITGLDQLIQIVHFVSRRGDRHQLATPRFTPACVHHPLHRVVELHLAHLSADS